MAYQSAFGNPLYRHFAVALHKLVREFPSMRFLGACGEEGQQPGSLRVRLSCGECERDAAGGCFQGSYVDFMPVLLESVDTSAAFEGRLRDEIKRMFRCEHVRPAKAVTPAKSGDSVIVAYVDPFANQPEHVRREQARQMVKDVTREHVTEAARIYGQHNDDTRFCSFKDGQPPRPDASSVAMEALANKLAERELDNKGHDFLDEEPTTKHVLEETEAKQFNREWLAASACSEMALRQWFPDPHRAAYVMERLAQAVLDTDRVHTKLRRDGGDSDLWADMKCEACDSDCGVRITPHDSVVVRVAQLVYSCSKRCCHVNREYAVRLLGDDDVGRLSARIADLKVESLLAEIVALRAERDSLRVFAKNPTFVAPPAIPPAVWEERELLKAKALRLGLTLGDERLACNPPANPTSIGEVWVGKTQPSATALAHVFGLGKPRELGAQAVLDAMRDHIRSSISHAAAEALTIDQDGTVRFNGLTVADCVRADAAFQREAWNDAIAMTQAQRDVAHAVHAIELRTKVGASSRARERANRNQVVVDQDDE